MKHAAALFIAVALALGLSACEKTTVEKTEKVVTTVPGPQGAPGPEGPKGEKGKSGDTVVIVPQPPKSN